MTRRLAVLLLAVCQVLLLGGGVVAAAYRIAAAPLSDDGPYVLLALGSDQGPPRAGSALAGRADAFQLIVVAPDRSAVTILSFPRDSYVPIPGLGTRKINAALTRGPETAVAAVEGLTGIGVDDYAVTSFAGFAAAVDQVGGLRIDVEHRLRDPFSGTNLQPGEQVLHGGQALAYARDRKSRPGGDFGRTEAQARALQALHGQLRADRPSADRLAELIGVFNRNTATSIPLTRQFQLAHLMLSIDPAAVTRVVVPGYNDFAGSAAIVRLSGGAYALFEDLRDDGKLTR